jgi:hypothetical protein
LSIGLHPNSQFRPHILEYDSDGLDNELVRICLAVLDHLMLHYLSLPEIHVVLLGQAVVPTAVPGRQGVRVFLVGTRELGACQLLNIDEAVTERWSTRLSWLLQEGGNTAF